jgi:hypothetical protein
MDFGADYCSFIAQALVSIICCEKGSVGDWIELELEGQDWYRRART